ncbi:Predicted dithiol-disulfide isomerase, DsbA family [Natronoarchaeum philippinense]|uniref:Predicted dithiol-disulfide isomerase, DsbA family n=1 Tax=Natronoarchaeum philippinense TaxID=558529 RepID=A0A285NTE8_NATPI|nr:DsbA family oxidoreductase [Natronoarchaeum philippinense]SNZ12488.1 Predicted dithiol-disulfide isomerase, DsbA family [Natronoarchaeum philippinense]
MSQTGAERITVFADYVCPFCYLGRQSLDQYQDEREEELEIDWRPFDLRSGKRGPDGEIDHSVDDGKDEEYFEQAKENVRRLQERYDAEMELELSREIDSLDAQVASYYVKEHYPYERWLAFDEAIYAALWQEGRDIGDADVLTDIAADADLDPEEIEDALDDDRLREELTEQFTTAQRQGVTGVPTFAYEGHAARGAVPPEQLRRLVEGE